MPLISLTPEISYLPSVEKPISSDVVFIKPDGSEITWIFDVGTSSEAARLINQIEGKKKYCNFAFSSGSYSESD